MPSCPVKHLIKMLSQQTAVYMKPCLGSNTFFVIKYIFTSYYDKMFSFISVFIVHYKIKNIECKMLRDISQDRTPDLSGSSLMLYHYSYLDLESLCSSP